MRNSCRIAIEEYNEKSFPVMAHKPSTQQSSITRNMQYYFAVNEKTQRNLYVKLKNNYLKN